MQTIFKNMFAKTVTVIPFFFMLFCVYLDEQWYFTLKVFQPLDAIET